MSDGTGLRDSTSLLLGIWGLEIFSIIVLIIRLATSLRIYQTIFWADILMIVATVSLRLSIMGMDKDAKSSQVFAITQCGLVTRQIGDGLIDFNQLSIGQMGKILHDMVSFLMTTP